MRAAKWDRKGSDKMRLACRGIEASKLAAMMQTFFKQKPSVDVPYRQIELGTNEGVWQVRLIAGEKAGREHATVLRTIPVKNFDDGLEPYDAMFRELQKDGWKPHSPH